MEGPEKLSQLRARASQAREQRDGCLAEARKQVDRRNEFNGRVRDRQAEAKVLRDRRDALNQRVRDRKAQRATANDRVRDTEHLLEQRYEELGLPLKGDRPSLPQTEDLEHELKEARDVAEAAHAEVNAAAADAQRAHEAMIEAYRANDADRKKADEAQKRYLEAKKQSDLFQHQYMEILAEIQREDPNRMQLDPEAHDLKRLRSRFRRGETLDVELVHLLQQEGML